jgi:hypothetical protein
MMKIESLFLFCFWGRVQGVEIQMPGGDGCEDDRIGTKATDKPRIDLVGKEHELFQTTMMVFLFFMVTKHERII